MANLIPELELIIGKQPVVPELPPKETQHRFQAVFRRFLSLFARKEHPLVIFLDDLQWLDGATLTLLENLVSQPDVQHLLIIGAYRDNEVSPSHPLMQTLDSIRQVGVIANEIVLRAKAGGGGPFGNQPAMSDRTVASRNACRDPG